MLLAHRYRIVAPVFFFFFFFFQVLFSTTSSLVFFAARICSVCALFAITSNLIKLQRRFHFLVHAACSSISNCGSCFSFSTFSSSFHILVSSADTNLIVLEMFDDISLTHIKKRIGTRIVPRRHQLTHGSRKSKCHAPRHVLGSQRDFYTKIEE